MYYSLSRLLPAELNAIRFACYQKGNDYFGPSLATDFERVRNTPRYKAFLAFYSSVRHYPTDPSRFLVSSIEESKRLHLDAGMREVLAMDLFVTPDPLSLLASPLVRRLECISDEYRGKCGDVGGLACSGSAAEPPAATVSGAGGGESRGGGAGGRGVYDDGGEEE